MSADPIEGFWSHPQTVSKSLYHFFVEGDENSVCGKWRLREMTPDREIRCPGGEGCQKCADIHDELFAVKPPSPPEPDWTVKTDPIAGTHNLLYQGNPYSSVRGEGGLKTQNELAALFNKNGTHPKKQKKVRCAADAPNPAKFLEKKSKQSPELPLADPKRAYRKQDFEELLTYLESLFDESAIGSVKKPVYFDQVAEVLDIEDEDTAKVLRWLYLARPDEIPTLCEWLAWKEEREGTAPSDLEPPHADSFEDLYFNIAARIDTNELLKIIRFIFQIKPPTPTPNIMPATKKAPAVDHIAPVVETFPASHYRRYPTNRTPDAEAVKNMSESIREVGVLQPIIARTIPGDTEIEILAGETRWLGCSAIDPEYPVPCFLRNVDDKEAAKIHAIENFQRKDLNPFEEGREIKHMLDCGWEMKEIAAHLGKGENWLYKRMSLLRMPEEGKTALMEGNLSLQTAYRILSLPEEKQKEAVKAVTEPVHAASALSEREALELIDDDFVKPLAKAAEWEERRDLLEKENPDCQWLKYEHAVKAGHHNSGYVRADYKPARDLLSDAAKLDELVVPSWKALAEKYAAPIYIGLAPWGPKEALLYVSPDAIVEAEKAAHNEKPEDCIFSHEKAVQKTRDDAARRKLEEEQRKEALKIHHEALKLERKKFAAMVLAPDGIGKAATKKLVETIFEDVCKSGEDFSALADALGVEKIDDYDQWSEKVRAETLKYLRSKAFTPFEAMGRLRLASYISDKYGFITEVMFSSGAAKPADFPAFHADYLKRCELVAKQEAEEKARAEQQKADDQREPDSNQEEDAA